MDGKSMFGDIKSKLGFGRKNDYEEFYEDYEEFEEGDDYGEYGYDESYERTSGSAYDPYDSVTTREPGERSRGRSSMPRLVSIDDVRARTAVPTLPDDDAPASRRGSSSSFRTMVDSSLPPQMTPEGTAAASAAASAVHHARSEGLNSLFESTTPPTDTRPTSSRGASASASGFALHPLSHAEGGGSRRLQRRRGRLHGAQARQCGGAEFWRPLPMRWPSASWTSPSAWPARWMRTWNVWATRCSPSLASTSSPRPSAPTCALRASSSAWRALKTFRLRSL